ncbi:MAG: TetR/AcrR family transcriptional regulator [Leptolyngbyaceae cyanobacterium RU_5_1]|nr:TetR/AcrR family transcriptional regulator [Leptolyngbyaceae cyanobacterium RU_5_1]
MSKNELTVQLLCLFRQYGYEGATLSKISEVTGLGKASLYHHFPGGKEDMATAVLEYLEQGLERHILQSLRSKGSAISRFTQMCDRVSQFYEGGQQSCLFAVLLMGAHDRFQEKIQQCLNQWLTAIAEVLIEEGIQPQLAQQRAEDAILQIQGALILARGLGNPTAFQRVITRLPVELTHLPPGS